MKIEMKACTFYTFISNESRDFRNKNPAFSGGAQR